MNKNLRTIGIYAIVFVAVFVVSFFFFRHQRMNAGVGGEDFETFHEKFLTDSVFQLSRIDFPLDGLPSVSDTLATRDNFKWTADRWDILKKVDYSDSGFERDLLQSDVLVREIFRHPQGYGVEARYFKGEDGKWRLIFYAGLNALRVNNERAG